MRSRWVSGFLIVSALLTSVPAADAQPVAERLTFEEAIRRALDNNPGVAEASQAILRAEALLQQASIVRRPTSLPACSFPIDSRTSRHTVTTSVNFARRASTWPWVA